MIRHYFIYFILALIVIFTGCASVHHPLGRDAITVRRGGIYRNDTVLTLQAVHEPDLCAKGSALAVMVPAMARVAAAGGNAVAFDLCGFSDNGKAISDESIAVVSAYTDRAKGQRMAVIVRIVGDDGTKRFRRNAVKTAAKALTHETKALYWIDGPDAANLAKQFKRLAPHLVVAAPQNGDLIVTANSDTAGDSGLYLLTGALPKNPRGNVNYVLPGSDATYAMLDKIYMSDAEKASWTPDNSMLSEEERAEGFISLFNGRDLNNWWSFYHGKESFRVNADGHIECYQSGAGGIMTNRRYDNYILRLEYKLLEKDANSGIHLRAPRAARQSKIGFEFQIMGDSYLTEPHKNSTAAVYDVVPALTTAARPEGEWNEVEIMLNGPRLKAVLNDVLVQDVNFDEVEELRYRLRRGFIGLQDHDSYVEFKNVRLKEL